MVGLREALIDAYEARFGTMPEELAARVRTIEQETTLRNWLKLTVTGTREAIAAHLGESAAR